MDSCAHVTSLERTRQGPFTLQHCLTGDQWTWEGIQLGIEEHRQILEKYLDVEMAQTAIRNLNAREFNGRVLRVDKASSQADELR